ncbi:MAG: (Fe-S)-binding protein [Acidobacteriota bacterium]|nr:(Fe-S)-binding protein [Acidobacteriota bacterium]
MTATITRKGLKVALFATCANDLMFPQSPIATVELLERLGCRVEFPEEQTCCGQIFTNTGYYDEAMGSVKNYLKAFEKYEFIVGPSGSCVGSVRHQHEMLARRDAGDAIGDRVAAVAARTYDISEFIVDVLGITDVGAYFPHRVTYHPSCHSVRVAKVGDKPLQLLKAVRGITVLDLPNSEQCCGMGGTFSLKNPDMSVAMAGDKARNVASTGAEYLVAGDNLCLLNISGVLNRTRAGIKPIHLVEILARTEGGN